MKNCFNHSIEMPFNVWLATINGINWINVKKSLLWIYTRNEWLKSYTKHSVDQSLWCVTINIEREQEKKNHFIVNEFSNATTWKRLSYILGTNRICASNNWSRCVCSFGKSSVSTTNSALFTFRARTIFFTILFVWLLMNFFRTSC